MMKTKRPFAKRLTLAALSLSLASANAAVVFSDNFESPTASTSYTLDRTSQTANTTKWVRGASGFNASRNGIVRENRVGETFVDPVGSQAYGFRYSSNTGVTTAFGQVGTLAVGQTITITFNVIRDNYSGQNYANYNASLVLFDGASTRSSTENLLNNTFALLDRAVGTASSNSSYDTISFSYTVGDPVIDNNGITGGASTTYLPSFVGKDIALRFAGQGNGAVVDNVSIDITAVPEPRAALLGGLGLLALLRRRR